MKSLCTLVGSLILLTAPTLLSQSSTATLSGTVSDSSGAVVPGARITTTNDATGLKGNATANNDGEFTIPLLPPGRYTVHAEQPGFTPMDIRDVVLEVGD